MIGWLYALVRGFHDNLAWGLAILFFPPLAMLIYAAVDWQRGRMPLYLVIAGVALGFASVIGAPTPAAASMQVAQSYMTNQDCGSDELGRNGRSTSFSRGDFICMKTTVTLDHSGHHRFTWLWFSGGQQVDSGARDVDFLGHAQWLTSPSTPSNFSAGAHRVELHSEGKLLDSQAFEVQ